MRAASQPVRIIEIKKDAIRDAAMMPIYEGIFACVYAEGDPVARECRSVDDLGSDDCVDATAIGD